MKKRFVAGLLILCMLVTGAVAAGGMRQLTVTEDTGISVTLNGEKQELKDANGNPVYPLVLNGTTYLPVRAVSGLVGLDVNWNNETRTVELGKDAKTEPIPIGEVFAVNPEDWTFEYKSGGNFTTTDSDICTVGENIYDWAIYSESVMNNSILHFGYLENQNKAQYLHFKMVSSRDMTLRLFSDEDRSGMCLREFELKADKLMEMDIDVKMMPEVYFFAMHDGWAYPSLTMVDVYFHN